ncbi:MAG TPA: FeoA family protein [Holophaga sp.]|nr:FeoA family protein [Holophaga sp.]
MSHFQQTPLSDLEPGQEAVVVQVAAKGPVRRRLLEMGFIRGACLKVEKLAPLGDPMELVIKGYHLSLRREEGSCILVTRLEPAEH